MLQDCADIDVLYAQAEFINDAFQSLVSNLVDIEFSSSNCSSQLSASHLKTTLRACFVEEGFEAIWHHMTPHDLHKTAIQHANGGDCSPEHSVFQHSEQMTNVASEMQLPGRSYQTTHTVVRIESEEEFVSFRLSALKLIL